MPKKVKGDRKVKEGTKERRGRQAGRQAGRQGGREGGRRERGREEGGRREGQMEEKTVPLYSLLIFFLAPKIHPQLLKCWPVLHAKPSNKIYVDRCLALMPLPRMEKHGKIRKNMAFYPYTKIRVS